MIPIIVYIVVTIAGLTFWMSLLSLFRYSDDGVSLRDLAFIAIATTFILSLQIPLAGEFLISDSLQYCWGGKQLLSSGRFSIPLAGTDFPPRFTPWFSLFVVAPTYFFSAQLESAIIPVLATGILGCLVAAKIGGLIVPQRGAFMAALALLTLSGFRYFSANVMTEIPTTAILISQLYLWINAPINKRSALLQGLLSALAVSFRPTMLASLPALAWQQRQSRIRLILLLTPTLLLGCIQLIYNQVTFGSPLRSGYHYWLSVPYDYPQLTFGFRYLANNLAASAPLWQLSFLIVLLLAQIEILRRRGIDLELNTCALKRGLLFVLATGLPQVVFYGLYFYATERFFTPLVCALVTLGAPTLALLTKRLPKGTFLILATSAYAGLALLQGYPPTPIQDELKELKQNLPKAGYLVSARDPLLLAYYLEDWQPTLQVIPFSRQVEFASKIITPKRPHEQTAPTQDPFNHRALANSASGVLQDVYNWTALEQPEKLEELVARGETIVLDQASVERSGYDLKNAPAVIQELARH